ncbi:MAG: PKD domain-containing protein, partial [Thermodesulfobacteriota bacterium]
PGYETKAYSLTLAANTLTEVGQVALAPAGSAGPLPDLAIAGLEMSGVAQDPHTLSLSGTLAVFVTNQGEGAAQPFVDAAAFSDSNRNGLYDPAVDLLLGRASTVMALLPGAEMLVNIPVTGSLPYRDAPILVWVDSLGAVAETDEGNNARSSGACAADATPGVDLTLARPELVDHQSSLSLSVRVGNAGAATASTSTVAVYEGDPAVGGILLATVSVPALAADSFLDVLLPEMAGITGGAAIHAVVDPDGLVDECREDNNQISVPAPAVYPDLTASDLAITDNGLGTPFTLSCRIGNGGNIPSPDQILVAVYNGDPYAGGILLGTTVIGPVAPGATVTAQLPTAGAIATGDLLSAVVDADDRLTEHTECNNLTQATAPGGGRGAITVATDAAQYGPRSPVQLFAQVTSTSALAATFAAELTIEDAGGTVLATFPGQATGALAPGAAALLSAAWETADLLAGSYRVRGRLVDGQGQDIHEAVAAFAISHAQADEPQVSLRIATDRTVYGANDTVRLESLVQNLTTNRVIDAASLRLRIEDQSSQQVFADSRDLGQLVPGAMITSTSLCSGQAMAGGSYLVLAEVVAGAAQTILASDQAQYEVRIPPTQSLAAQAAVLHPLLAPGAAQESVVTITNTGSLPVSGLALRQFLAAIDGQTRIGTRTAVLDLAAGQSQTLTETFATAGLASGEYDFVLQALLDGNWVTLAFAPFHINRRPVAHAGPDQHVFIGDLAFLDGSASTDADGEALGYLWRILAAPLDSLSQLSDPTAAMPTLAIDRHGAYLLQLVVGDGHEESAPDTVLLTVGNVRPVAHAGPDQPVFIGDTVILDGSASSDVDGDGLSYQWTILEAPAGSLSTLADPTAAMPSLIIDRHGEYRIGLTVQDGIDASEPDTVLLTVGNVPPVAHAGPDQEIGSDLAVLDGTASRDADGDALTCSWSILHQPADSTALLSDPAAAQPTLFVDQPGQYILQLIVHDGYEPSEPDTVVLDVVNIRPQAEAGPDRTVMAGETVPLDGTASQDANGDPLSYRWSITSRPANSVAALADPAAAQPSFTPDLEGVYIVQLIVSDGLLDSPPDTTTIAVANRPPALEPITAILDPVAVQTQVCASAVFHDPGEEDLPAAVWDWDDGTVTDGLFSTSDGADTVAGCHSYAAAGVYTLALTLTDDDGATAQAVFQYVVVYDPEAGFVTGGGWIASPAGAYALDPTLTGKASFGFTARYHRGATVPTGQTEFQFRVAGLNFHSTSYDWLVVAGAKAKYKGDGAINSAGGFGFLLTATDGQLAGGGGVDTFRMKIWDKATGTVIYDNQPGEADDAEATTALGGGSIVIHR